MGQQETAREITNPNPNKAETEMLISCRMWTTSPQSQILFKASLSCTFLNTPKQWSRRSSKDRIPTMRHVSRTHRLALDWSFDRINLNPKIQIKYEIPKTNSRTCWPKVVFRVMNGNVSVFSCSHFLSNRKQGVMSKRARESIAKEGSAVAKPRPMILCQGTSWAKREPFRKIRVLRTAQGVKSWIRVMFHRGQEIAAKQQPRPNSIFSRATTRWHSIFEHQATDAEWKTGKLSEHQEIGARWWLKIERHVWKSTVCKSPTTDTLKKSSKTCGKNWISQKRHQCSVLKLWTPMYWSGDHLCRQRRKPLFILDKITLIFWNSSGTQNFEEQNLLDLTQRLILDHQAWNSECIYDWLESPPHGWDLRLRTIKWSSVKVHVYSASVLCLGKMQEHSEANRGWENQLEEFRQSNCYRELFGINGELMELEWNISQDLLHWRSSRRPQKDLQDQNM